MSHLGVVNSEDLEVAFFLGKAILVNTNDDLSPGVNLCLSPGSRLFNSELGHARDNSLCHTAHFFDFIDNLEGLFRELLGQGLHHVGASPGVSNMSDTSLFLDDELGVTSDTRGKLGGEGDGFVEGVSVERLSATEDSC